MKGIALAVALLTLATAQSRPHRTDKSSPNDLSVPLLRTLSLGDDHAAAAIAHLAFVQYVGGPVVDPHVVLSWAQLITDLDPTAYQAYYFAGVFAFTDEKEHAKLDQLLARGQAQFPDSVELTLLRAFAAHFGVQDVKAAAYFYGLASRQPNAPPYVGALAERLAADSSSCGAVSAFAAQQDRSIGLPLLKSCLKRQIELAAAAYRLRFSVAPADISTLQQAGLLGPLPSWSGLCWTLHGMAAELAPC